MSGLCLTSRGSGVRIPVLPRWKSRGYDRNVISSFFVCANNLQTTRRFTALFLVCLLDNFTPRIDNYSVFL